MKRLSLCALLLYGMAILTPLFSQASEIPEPGAGNAPVKSPVELRLSLRSGISWQGQGLSSSAEDESFPNGVSSSQIINHAGIAVQLEFSQFLGIYPTLDIHTDEYLYREEYGMAFPTQQMTGSFLGPLATVLALNLNIPWYMDVRISDLSSFYLAAGPGFLFRLPVIPLDGTEDMSSIRGYLLGEGRWFYMYLEPGMRFVMNDWFSFSLGSKVLLPVWHAWDSTSLPFYDSLFSGVVLSFNLDL